MKGKTTYLRRPLSFVVVMAMLLANMFGAGATMAEETSSETSYYDDTGPEELVSETEEITYCVSLPWMEGCLYSYDQTHQLILEGEQETERQDIILNYRKDEEVKIGILISDFFDVAELHLFNSKDETIDRKESAYTWDAEKRELDFFMPEEDLFLELKIEERVMETQSDMAWQEADIIEADPAVDAVTVPETFINEVQENTEVSIQDQEQEIFSEHKENTTVSEPDEVQTYGMVLEMDGLPTQGSIIQMETMTIPYDTWEFNPETDFTNITFSTEENSITYISDDIDYVNPGMYSSIYRVQQRSTERMWYVLRPVRVAEPDAMTDLTEQQTETEEEMQEPNPSFDLYKVNADDESEKLEGIVFRLFSSSDQEAEKARQIAEAVEALREEQQITVYSANTDQGFRQNWVLPQLPVFCFQ